ncbi:putative muscle m-line assembly protein unc-89 [Operophtera brumata]|uniref:Putative muscle m-line assembly protein unc-89 n=1 Tax=Operophtera brumata TaxID=104452 RepID=A0A0L7LLL2_OPEBR|nr:putative muscle m-line assembly protein unc-89 [Operophtera brumata]
MRSQATKTSPNKGAVSITPLKTKRARKKTVVKKIKKVIRKPLVKGTKKNASKNEKEGAMEDKNESHLETRASTSKSNPSQNAPSTKKARKGHNEKKDTLKTMPDTTVKKVNLKKPVKKKPVKKIQSSDETKYKSNKDEPKKKTTKLSKGKTILKKGKACASHKKYKMVQSKEIIEKEINVDDKTSKEDFDRDENDSKPLKQSEEPNNQELNKDILKDEENNKETTLKPTLDGMSAQVPTTNQHETTKQEIERPPKFFTSSRSPRMVDIDVKCCKNSKGNLSVSERFVSLKCEIKSNEDKKFQNTLVTSQGPEIDVYTFTEKVDSPKSILSDIRNPINQNIGRVRPIARVKGTIMDKKTESERKKFSPHRPIEEVVKQLKAKKSEEVSANQTKASSSFDLNIDTDLKSDEAPKPIVSKSYKMVARKSSVTGIPFSPIKFLDQDVSPSSSEKPATKSNSPSKKTQIKGKKKNNNSSSDDELESSKFSLNTQTFQYPSSDECGNNESNDESKESSASDTSIAKKPKYKRYKKITDSAKKNKSTELKELSKDSLVDLKDDILGKKKKGKQPHHRPLHKYWKGPKKQRMALLNAKLVVQNLLANEFQTNMDLGLMKTVAMQPIPSTSKRPTPIKKKETKPKDSEKRETTSESEYENTMEKKEDSSDSSDDSLPQRSLRGEPGIRSAGKYWDPKSYSSSSEDSELETKKKVSPEKKKIPKSSSGKSDSDKPPAKIKKTAPVKKKRNRNEVNMDFKDMVVQKRMASLNASAMIELSYEKRSPKSNKEETTTDSGSDESFSQKPKNGVGSGVKSELKNEEPKQEPESDETAGTDSKQKVETSSLPSGSPPGVPRVCGICTTVWATDMG